MVGGANGCVYGAHRGIMAHTHSIQTLMLPIIGTWHFGESSGLSAVKVGWQRLMYIISSVVVGVLKSRVSWCMVGGGE